MCKQIVNNQFGVLQPAIEVIAFIESVMRSCDAIRPDSTWWKLSPNYRPCLPCHMSCCLWVEENLWLKLGSDCTFLSVCANSELFAGIHVYDVMISNCKYTVLFQHLTTHSAAGSVAPRKFQSLVALNKYSPRYSSSPNIWERKWTFIRLAKAATLNRAIIKIA